MTVRGLRLPAVAGVLAAALLAGGCQGFRDAAGLTKEAPDEFRVTTNKPLSIPPEFTLRPPKREGERPDAQQPREQARTAVFTGEDKSSGVTYEGSAGMSRGERALLGAAGASEAEGQIRDTLEAEATARAGDRTLAERLIFWQDRRPDGEMLNAAKESKRLRENAALGDPVTKGKSESADIERGKRGWLEGIF